MSLRANSFVTKATQLSLLLGMATTAWSSPTFVNALTVPGDANDLSGLSSSFERRLSFGSDLIYDRATNQYYGLADRGPGGGVLSYETRVHRFGLTVNANSGAISNFALQQTVLFKDNQGNALNGLNPSLLPGGDRGTLGRSFDPEGIVRAANGNYFVADEYGRAIREFNSAGQQLRI